MKIFWRLVSIAGACVAAVACGSDGDSARAPSADAGTGGASANAGGSSHTGGASAGTGGSVATGGRGSGAAGAGGRLGTGGTSSGGAAGGGTSGDAGIDASNSGGANTGGSIGTGGSTVSAWSCQQADTSCLCVEAATPTDNCTLPKAKCCFSYTGASGVANCQCWDRDPAAQGCTTLIEGLGGTAVSTCPP